MRVPSLVVVVLTLVGAGLSAAAPPVSAADSPSGGFIVTCEYSHTLSDDPIVFPDQPGMSHSHDFYGNESTNAASTYQSMTEATSNCGIDTDTAGYWVPTPSLGGQVFEPNGRRGDMRIYYRAAGAEGMSVIPTDLRMIGGDKEAAGPPPLRFLKWYCGAGTGGTTPPSTHPYDCTPYAAEHSFVDGVVAIVTMPRCWNGVGRQPSDVQYAGPGPGVHCPSGYGAVLPLITERVHFGIMDPCLGATPCGPTDPDTNVQLTLSSGPYYTLHADFWNTWDQGVLDQLTQDCLNGHVACSFLGSRVKLNVALDGTGTGTVTSSPDGIDCGSTCTATFGTSTHVLLTATPAEGNTFSGWGGACSGTETCEVALEHSRDVTATFDSAPDQTYSLSVLPGGDGAGLVTSDPEGVDCGVSCGATFPAGTVVRLFAEPDDESLFGGWGGDCTGAGGCQVTMARDATVSARFVARVHRPDTAIHTGHHPTPVGSGTINTTGFNQTIQEKLKPGSQVTFFIRIDNRGNAADVFRVRGGGDRGPFHVRYLAGSSGDADIRDGVLTGGFTTGTLPRGDGRVIRLVVSVAPKAKPGTTWTWRIVTWADGNTDDRDIVQARVVAIRR
jgi:hypothetical protein